MTVFLLARRSWSTSRRLTFGREGEGARAIFGAELSDRHESS